MLATRLRPQFLEKLKTHSFDLLVIGGGVTGAGIALDAAARGMKVALVEKGDFASGTSSKSTKLIHGGLRYLKQLEINIVREVGRERAILHRLAPHLVRAEKMLLPIVRGGSLGRFSASLGLWLYDFLANVKGDDRRRMLSKNETLALEPLLRSENPESSVQNLLGGGIYAEYRTDDARLTIEIIKAAERLGAVCLNYVEVVDFQEDDNVFERNDTLQKVRLSGVVCEEKLSGQRFSVAGKYVVNAAGAWVQKVAEQGAKRPVSTESVDRSDRSERLGNPKLFLSKGIHVVVAHERLPLKHSVYFDLPDGRMMFAIPRQRATYLGTTDTPFHGDPDHVFAENQDVAYVLAGTNRMFPAAKLTFADVESTWAGLRPLIFEEGKSASEMSRKDEIFISPHGLISIAGGKLTGYRKMAERVVNLVAGRFKKEHGKSFAACSTHQIPLHAEPFSSVAEVAVFQKGMKERVAGLGLSAHFAAYLVENYGKDAGKILAQAASDLSALGVLTGLSNKQTDLALMRSELEYCFENEMVMKPLDFLERRTGRLYFNFESLEPSLDEVLAAFAERQLGEEREAVLQRLKQVRTFDEA